MRSIFLPRVRAETPPRRSLAHFRAEYRTALETRAQAECRAAFVILDDQHLLEDRLIEHSLDVFGCVTICSTTVDSEVQCQLQVPLDCFRFQLVATSWEPISGELAIFVLALA